VNRRENFGDRRASGKACRLTREQLHAKLRRRLIREDHDPDRWPNHFQTPQQRRLDGLIHNHDSRPPPHDLPLKRSPLHIISEDTDPPIATQDIHQTKPNQRIETTNQRGN
jgi:hypothetical protein